jgi:hypothetical protein
MGMGTQLPMSLMPGAYDSGMLLMSLMPGAYDSGMLLHTCQPTRQRRAPWPFVCNNVVGRTALVWRHEPKDLVPADITAPVLLCEVPYHHIHVF